LPGSAGTPTDGEGDPTDKLTVLIVSQLYAPETGGNASRIGDMARQLKSLGLEVTVLSPHPTLPFGTFPRSWKRKADRIEDCIRVTNLWSWQPGAGDPGFVSRMAYYLLFALHAAAWALWNRKKYDVIITTSPPIFVTLPGLLAKTLSGKHWIVDVRDLWIDASVSLGFIKKGSLYEKISRRFEWLFYSRSDMVTVTTMESVNRIVQAYPGLDREKFVLVSNGVDTEKFWRPGAPKKKQIIYSGNIGHAQDLEKVILAMGEVSKKHDVRLVIVGDGDLKGRLVSMVKENNLEDSVVFKDLVPRDEVPELISESSIGVAPLKDIETLEYAIPTKVFEYMACGIPFVGCSRGEIANIAGQSRAGIIARNDVRAIADALCSLLEDPGLGAEMGKNGRRYVKEHYDRRNIARVLREKIILLI
jgi:glycosyltransferase involved in cell wall biosynthesis